MMFTTFSTRFAGMKSKVLAGAAIAGAAMLLAVPAAQAQRVRFGVRIGARVYVAPAPAYVAPAYVAPDYAAGPEVVFAGPGYYDGIYFRDYDAWRTHYGHSEQHFDRDRGYARGFDRNQRVDRQFARRR
jgi:hypothetical protein